ncbi:MAG TPA: 2Fe-2S iron-sulfur cluster-binding protein [Candidatus Aminicenantes bacterium]|nr:2Fe-2S iron-sulfur cluster-binding protein [Candidatus Aminicenantes bacterium]HRY64717.1 2Fe-2S iron-sulfur cluster-binding protein [Candidatus Aminicenantes bacterium]HRZ71630.1 2Fe-2S iron-sulfur cluster-binding protein [Candidatus Aminicenantes bacterium]
MKLTIDGRDVVCRDGATILEAARGAGIPVPSLCDHPGLEPFAGCRICLVEIEGRRDYAPACATPAAEGQVVRTQTPEIAALRRKVLELILAQHPYACLICSEKKTCDDLKSTIRKTGEVTGCVLCPENGGCELQRVAAEVGLERVEQPASYRNLDVHKEDPFFDRDYNLCILCGRCIRVCEEVRGAAVLSFVHRGGRTEVGTALGRPLLDSGCRFCGACVDVCPTGALVERAVRPQPAAGGTAGIVCPFCGQGCVLTLRLRDGGIVDARPAAAEPNRGQACVKGRFLVRGAAAGTGRIMEPRVRKDGKLEPVALEAALDRAAAGLRAAGRAALVYPAQVPLEDAYVFLRFGRELLGTRATAAAPAEDIDAALDAFAVRLGFDPPAERRLAGLEACETVLAWNVDLPRDHPIAWLSVVRAARRGARLVVAGPAPAGPVVRASATLDLGPGGPAAAAGLAAAVLETLGSGAPDLPGLDDLRRTVAGAPPASRPARKRYGEAARILAAGRPAAILFDDAALGGPEDGETLAWLWNVARLIGAALFPLARGANERGVHALARARRRPVPDEGLARILAGLGSREFEALYLAGPVPDLGETRPPFLVCQDTHWSRNAERADVVLPAAVFAETGGTWVSTEGRVRTYPPAVAARGAARPDGELVAALAGRFGRPGFPGADRAAVLRELCDRVPALRGYRPSLTGEERFPAAAPAGTPGLVLVTVPPRRRSRRPGKAAEPAGGPAEVLRGWDLAAGNRGYARTRRPL